MHKYSISFFHGQDATVEAESYYIKDGVATFTVFEGGSDEPVYSARIEHIRSITRNAKTGE